MHVLVQQALDEGRFDCWVKAGHPSAEYFVMTQPGLALSGATVFYDEMVQKALLEGRFDYRVKAGHPSAEYFVMTQPSLAYQTAYNSDKNSDFMEFVFTKNSSLLNTDIFENIWLFFYTNDEKEKLDELAKIYGFPDAVMEIEKRERVMESIESMESEEDVASPTPSMSP